MLEGHAGCVVLQTGEGVNDVRKGACASHVSTMASFLKVRLPPEGLPRGLGVREQTGAASVPTPRCWPGTRGRDQRLLPGRPRCGQSHQQAGLSGRKDG